MPPGRAGLSDDAAAAHGSWVIRMSAALRDSAQGADEPARGGGVEILRRLVEDQAAGIAEERAGAAEDEAVCLTGRQAGAIPMR